MSNEFYSADQFSSLNMHDSNLFKQTTHSVQLIMNIYDQNTVHLT